MSLDVEPDYRANWKISKQSFNFPREKTSKLADGPAHSGCYSEPCQSIKKPA
jgi:hypothetical protein